MREIKYRVWDKEYIMTGTTERGAYVEDYEEFLINPDGELMIFDGYKDCFTWLNKERYIIEQYTGLKDIRS